jgi:protein-S-isoprenylcysteine O-methyltransferase Ste14
MFAMFGFLEFRSVSVRRRAVMRQWSAPREQRSFLAPAIIGVCLWLSFPTGTAFQDMTSLVAGAEAAAGRWSAVVERSVAGSVHQAEMPFAGSATTAAISGAGFKASGIGAVAFRTKNGSAEETPDEAASSTSPPWRRPNHSTPVPCSTAPPPCWCRNWTRT